MPRRAAISSLTALALLALAGLVWPTDGGACAGEAAGLAPQPPRGKGERCVAETSEMRRNHMKLLDHQRGETVQAGVRDKPFSLKACIACHAVDGPDGRPVSAESPQHFCRTCHDYVAVRIDCFTCHASRPGEQDAAAAPSLLDHGDVAAMGAFLRENGK